MIGQVCLGPGWTTLVKFADRRNEFNFSAVILECFARAYPPRANNQAASSPKTA
jgi:hypothetical protein